MRQYHHPMKLIDTHCHLDFEEFDQDRDDVVSDTYLAGVESIILPGVKASSWDNLVKVSQKYGFCYAIGLHPCFIEDHSKNDLILLETMLAKSNPVAIGEIGLDFYHGINNKNLQLDLFESQVNIAQSNALPVIIHARKSHDDILHILKKQNFKFAGTIHAFNGSLQQAHKYIDLGFKLGFGGMLTYERSTHLRKLASSLPLESIVTETDAPDMTGAKHHHQRNSPAYIPEVIETLALIRNQSEKIIAEQIWSNAEAVFKQLSCS